MDSGRVAVTAGVVVEGEVEGAAAAVTEEVAAVAEGAVGGRAIIGP